MIRATDEIRAAYVALLEARAAVKAARKQQRDAYLKLAELTGGQDVEDVCRFRPWGDYVPDGLLAEDYPEIFAELARPKGGYNVLPWHGEGEA